MDNTKYKQYALDVINGDIMACEYVKLACHKYLKWFERDDMYFNSDKVDKVVRFMGKLKHFTGLHNGKSFVLQPFQFWIVCNIYGWHWTDTNQRVTKNVYIELARKNGKSFFAAAIALYNLIADGEANAEVEIIANSAKQAGIVFSMCKNLVDGLDAKHKYFKAYRDKIKFDTTKSFLQVLSTDVNSNDGWNSSTFIVDEYHSSPNSLMYDVMKSSQGMRENPLSVVITTAGFNLFSPCYNMRKTNIEILYGNKQDDTQFSAIYTLDDGDEWDNPKNWIKANPCLGVTVKEQYLKEQVTQAKNNTSMEVGIRTKNFNQWLSTSDVWINNDLLLKSSKKLDISFFKDLNVYMGVDLAAVSDLTAISVCCELDGIYYFKTYYFLPQSALSDNSNSELYKDWKRKGLLIITDGNVVDYDYILSTIMKINNTAYINKIAYDNWNATQWAIDATSEGLPLEPFSQALWNFNKPTKEFERLIKSGRIVLDDNEITRYCFSNVVLKFDHNENCKPTKLENQQKIDGVIAMIQALGIMIQEPQYNQQILAVV